MCTHTHYITVVFSFCFSYFPSHKNQIIALISLQLLRFQGIWEKFQRADAHHKAILSLLPGHVIPNSCTPLTYDTLRKNNRSTELNFNLCCWQEELCCSTGDFNNAAWVAPIKVKKLNRKFTDCDFKVVGWVWIFDGKWVCWQTEDVLPSGAI